MYVFVHGNFTDPIHAFHAVEDCLHRGLTKDQIKLFVTAEGDKALDNDVAPVVEEPAEPPKRGKKDEGPKFDPNAHLYWKKLKTIMPVNIITADGIDALNESEQVKLALTGSRTLLEKGNLLVLVDQPSQLLDEKFDWLSPPSPR